MAQAQATREKAQYEDWKFRQELAFKNRKLGIESGLKADEFNFDAKYKTSQLAMDNAYKTGQLSLKGYDQVLETQKIGLKQLEVAATVNKDVALADKYKYESHLLNIKKDYIERVQAAGIMNVEDLTAAERSVLGLYPRSSISVGMTPDDKQKMDLRLQASVDAVRAMEDKDVSGRSSKATMAKTSRMNVNEWEGNPHFWIIQDIKGEGILGTGVFSADQEVMKKFKLPVINGRQITSDMVVGYMRMNEVSEEVALEYYLNEAREANREE